MSYTVKELAEISGVSSRTLRWYDAVGLLKPAYHGANGYRYYEEEQLLLLQQILFFRELGFRLDDIRKVLESTAFDKVKALSTHRHLLKRGLDQTRTQIATIDQTLLHLKGEKKMDDKAFYAGFDKGKEHLLAEYQGTIAEDLILKNTPKEWAESEKEELSRENEKTYRAIAKCLEKNLKPKSEEVQSLVEEQYQLVSRYYSGTKEVYLAYAQLYAEHAPFRDYFDRLNPKLADFIAEAMRVYAQGNLS